MKDRIPELLQRNLQEVFGEGDATRRRASFAMVGLRRSTSFSTPCPHSHVVLSLASRISET